MRAPWSVNSRGLFATSPGPVIVVGIVLSVALGLWWLAPDLFFGRWSGRPWGPVASRVPAAAQLDSADGALLPSDQAIALAHPCSREAPPIVRRVWVPTSGDIQRLEADLSGLLHTIEDTLTRMPGIPPLQLNTYRRQYAGLELVTGERIVYTNAFHPAELRLFAEVGRDSADWRRWPVQVCDGWRGFWGVEYDPAKRRFRGFSFNGIA
jgi:hypothetical protein